MQVGNPADVMPHAASAFLAAIVASSDDAIVSKTLEGIVTTWNAGAERIFGWTAAEVVGNPITIIIPPDRLGEEPEILRRIGSGERVEHFQTVRQTRDGRLLDVSVTISPVRDETGQIIGVSKVARDITAQKKLERELRETKEAAEALNNEKDHFLSVLSHELRAPLMPALAAISLIEQDGGVPPHLAEHLDMIRRNVEAEARLVDDLLDVTRIAHGKIELQREAVDAHALLRDVAAMFVRQAEEKGLNFATFLDAAHQIVWADPGRFQQMLVNLVTNAVKFTPSGGSVTFRTSDDETTLRIEIADTGIGIRPEVLPRLFQPFEQGEPGRSRQFGGLGLGLSIVRSLADLHDASISVHSEGVNQGTTFSLRMPIATEVQRSHARKRTEVASEVPSRKGWRVLLVEDHRDTRLAMGKLLTKAGCVVTPVASIREALETGHREPFDILLSDIDLPDGSGLDLMRNLAAGGRSITGIALSGYGQDEDVRLSHDAGFAHHLVKPVNFRLLLKVISDVIPSVRDASQTT